MDAVGDGFRTQLWPLPALGILLGLALGVGLPRVDAHIDSNLGDGVSSLLFGGGPSAARTLLGAIAGSLITVTSLTFSLTVLTLQLASSQYSPRLLRTFTRDRFVHVTLALFLATFTFALAVLRSVRDPTDAAPQFVPQLSVTLAFMLGIASVLGLVLFLAHLAREIRVETMLRKVHADASETMRRVLPEADGDSAPGSGPSPPANAMSLLARESGFLARVDQGALLAAAEGAGAVVRLDRPPGSSLVTGTPVGATWPLAGRFEPETEDRLRDQVAAAITTEFERTAAQDYGYGLRQLTDVTVKALSPGVNDPTTAIHALGHISALLCELSQRELGNLILRDSHERIRVVLVRPTLADALDSAITQPRRCGAGDPFVMGRLYAMLGELAWCVTATDHRQAVSTQLARLDATIATQNFDATEVEHAAALAGEVRSTLADSAGKARLGNEQWRHPKLGHRGMR